MPPSRFLQDLPPELFGELVAREVRAREARAARGPVIRRQPRALPGEPHIELDGDDDAAAARGRSFATRGDDGGRSRRDREHRNEREPSVDYSYDQRPDGAGGALARGVRVQHAQFGEGVVLACEGSGADRKATVRFDLGEKRVLVRFLTLA
jgi:DNA helicase-2/ATP-dependent DNA helicase PcrA